MGILTSKPCFVDWLTIHQKHCGLPELNNGYFVELNAESSEEWRTAKRLRLEGSFSSAVMLRAHAGQIDLSGNVGRWNRFDNVFNLDFDRTIGLSNQLLDCFGLPLFSDDGDYWEDKNGVICSLGAQVTRLDLTRNYATGSPANAARYMAWLDGLSLPYIRRGRAVGSTTVQWGSPSGRFKLIAYNKAQEMLDHCKNDTDRALMRSSRIFQYCNDSGIVRVELKLASLELRERGLRFLGDINMEKLQAVFDEKVDLLHGAFVRDDLDLADLPKAVNLTYAAFMSGVDVTQILSKSTLYRHASVLRPYGVDILSAPDVQRIKTQVRELTIEAVDAPDWYWQEQA